MRIVFTIFFFVTSSNLYAEERKDLLNDSVVELKAFAYIKELNIDNNKEEWCFVYEFDRKAYFFYLSNKFIKYGSICIVRINIHKPSKVLMKKLSREKASDLLLLFGRGYDIGYSYKIIIDEKVFLSSEIDSTFCVLLKYCSQITFNLYRQDDELYSVYEFNYKPNSSYKFSSLEIVLSKVKTKKEIFFDKKLSLLYVNQTTWRHFEKGEPDDSKIIPN